MHSEDYFETVCNGLMFLIHGLSIVVLVHFRCDALEVCVDHYWSKGLVPDVLEFHFGSWIWQEVELIALVDLLAEVTVILECLLAIMTGEALRTDLESSLVCAQV